MSEKQFMSVELDAELVEGLDAKADALGVSRSALIRTACQTLVEAVDAGEVTRGLVQKVGSTDVNV